MSLFFIRMALWTVFGILAGWLARDSEIRLKLPSWSLFPVAVLVITGMFFLIVEDSR